LKLFNYWRSSSSWRVRIALAHKGLEYEYVPVHLVKEGGEQHADWFRAMNPAEQVPVLEFEDDFGNVRRLGQSLAILGWLEERYPAPPLLPTDRYQRARARQLAELVNSGIQPLQNLSVIQKLRALDQDAKTWCREAIARGLASYEAIVAETAGAFSVGDAPSWADACLVPQLYNARRFELDLAPYPTIAQVESNCLERPEFDATRPENMPDAQV
jgi:maleylpyruvate isomerase